MNKISILLTFLYFFDQKYDGKFNLFCNHRQIHLFCDKICA